MTGVVDDQVAAPGSTARRAMRGSLAGVAGAIVGYLLAMTPSLLPRPPLFLGLVGGIAAAIGYGLGAAVARLARAAGLPDLAPPRRHRLAIAMAIVCAVAAAVGAWVGLSWQNDIRDSLGQEPMEGGLITTVAAAGGIFIALVALGRFLRRMTATTIHALRAHLPHHLAAVLGVSLVAVTTWFVLTGFLVNAVVWVCDQVYASKNEGSAEGVQPTQSSLRSGGPGSLVPWQTLGREGRAFIAGGPAEEALRAPVGGATMEPIRVYLGLDSAQTPEQRADLAVAELKRTGAFDREVLVVAGVAGTGWLESQSIDSLEHIWAGDTAIVASQYSYLPSWISFLVDQERAQAEGRALFDAVHAAWDELAPEDRPRLIVYGLSLGSYEIQSSFDSADDLAASADGAVLAGTPSFTEPWRSIAADRDAGSPQWQPVVDGGRTIRFADDGADLAALGPWDDPRVTYLQHADDPVVWWSPKLLIRRPDWLAEPPGPAVSSRMHWMPIITFLHVTVDQFFGVNAPNGFGHNYSLHMAQTWADVVGTPDGWTDADTERVQQQVLGE